MCQTLFSRRALLPLGVVWCFEVSLSGLFLTRTWKIGKNGSQCKYMSVLPDRSHVYFASRPAYIAGVTNPIFESSRAWDILFDISSGNVTVTRDIHSTYPTVAPAFGVPSISRSGTLKAESSATSETDLERKEGGRNEGVTTNSDKIFIEDVGKILL